MLAKSTRKRRLKWRPKVWTPICLPTKESYMAYKWYGSKNTFYTKRYLWEIIEMAYPIYNTDWSVKRYQRMYVDLKDLQPYYNKFLENIDFVINEK